MTHEVRLKWMLNIVFWSFVLFITGAITIFIRQYLPHFPFLIENIVGVVVFFVLLRWLFFLPYSYLGKNIWLKVLTIIAFIPLFMYIQQGIQQYHLTLELGEPLFFLRDYLYNTHGRSYLKFLDTEYVFFLIGALILIPIVLIRLIISIWRNINRDEA